MNEKQEYWNKRVQDTQIKLNKLAWSFAQAEINLKNNFTEEYNVLKEDENRFMEAASKSADIPEPTEVAVEASDVENNTEVLNEEDKMPDMRDEGNTEGEGIGASN